MSSPKNGQPQPPQDLGHQNSQHNNRNDFDDDLNADISYAESSRFDPSIDDAFSHIPEDNEEIQDIDLGTTPNTRTGAVSSSLSPTNSIQSSNSSPNSPSILKRHGGHSYDSYEDNTDDVVIHSIPHPDELPRAKKTESGSKSSKAMQTFAGVAGNILEWYDFAVFGFFSDEISRVFFPPQEGNAGIVESFTVFGLAFLMRPVGGAFLGYVGDKYGRKRALEISIFLMAFPTFAMGCLPSYERVGAFSIVSLVIVRCLQGLSVGGQLVSSLVFTLEHNPRHQWGLYGSFVMAAANFGTLLGGLIATLLRSVLNDEQLLSYGWRIPFLSGILVSFCGLYLRMYGEEDSIDHHHGSGTKEGGNSSNPLCMAVRKENLRALVAASLVPMLWSGGFYISFVWMATFMRDLIEPPVPGAFYVNSSALFISVCLLFPLAGILSDIFGRTKVMYIGGTSLAILSPIMIYVISQGSAAAAFFAQSAMGIAVSLWGAPMCAWLVESFPPEIRLTSVAVGYNVAQAIAGGSSPALATLLVDSFGKTSPGFMVSGIAIFSIIGLYIGQGIANYDDGVVNRHAVPERSPSASSSDNLFNYDSDDNSSVEKKEMELI